MLFLLLMVFLVCHPRRGSASALAVACSLCHPTQILSFRPKQFAHFANCEAQKPASLPKPLTSQDIRCCRCLLPQGMPSPNPPKPVKPLRQVTTIESTISMCIAIPSISLYIDRREQKAPERSGAFLLHQIEQKPFEWNTLRDGYTQNQYFTTRQNRSPDLSRIIPIL
jgi:hypothetical protein